MHIHRASVQRAIEGAPRPGECAVPGALDFDEIAPVSLSPLQIRPEDERPEQRHPDVDALRDHRPQVEPVLLDPKHRKGDHQEDAVRARQRRQRAQHAGKPPAAHARAQDRGHTEHEEERFGVDRVEEERGWEQRKRPERAPGDGGIEVDPHELIEEHQRHNETGIRDEISGNVFRQTGDTAEPAHRHGKERPKGIVPDMIRGIPLDRDQPVPESVPHAQRFDQMLPNPTRHRGHGELRRIRLRRR